MTVGTLPARLELRRIAPGQYEAPELGVGIVRVGGGTWAVTRRGEAIPVRGILEHPTLTQAHGLLADARDRAWRRRHGR